MNDCLAHYDSDIEKMLIKSEKYNLTTFAPHLIETSLEQALLYLKKDKQELPDENIKLSNDWLAHAPSMYALFTFHFPLNDTPQNLPEYLTHGLDTKVLHGNNREGDSIAMQYIERSPLKGLYAPFRCLPKDNELSDIIGDMSIRDLIIYYLNKGLAYKPPPGGCLVSHLVLAELEKEALELKLKTIPENSGLTIKI